MYEELTAFLPALQNADSYGELVIDKINDGTPEHPIQFPWMNYSDAVSDFRRAVYSFVDEHEEMDLRSYQEILERNGIRWSQNDMSRADVSKLDGQTVMALILGAIRADRFCDGALEEFLTEGQIQKWVRRLEEIDSK